MLTNWMWLSSVEIKPEVLLRGRRCETELKCSTAGPYINPALGSFKSALTVNPVYPSSACIFILSFVRTDLSNFRFSNGNNS